MNKSICRTKDCAQNDHTPLPPTNPNHFPVFNDHNIGHRRERKKVQFVRITNFSPSLSLLSQFRAKLSYNKILHVKSNHDFSLSFNYIIDHSILKFVDQALTDCCDFFKQFFFVQIPSMFKPVWLSGQTNPQLLFGQFCVINLLIYFQYLHNFVKFAFGRIPILVPPCDNSIFSISLSPSLLFYWSNIVVVDLIEYICYQECITHIQLYAQNFSFSLSLYHTWLEHK